jgi:hypothetical protein
MNWLSSPGDEIEKYEHKMHSLHVGKPAELVDSLNHLSAGSKYKRSYKAPNDIASIKAMGSIAKL